MPSSPAGASVIVLFSNAPAPDFDAILVRSGMRYRAKIPDGSFDIRAAEPGDFVRLRDALKKRGVDGALLPGRLVARPGW